MREVVDCTDRCRRIHPHCSLKLSRSIAPDHFWHWIVTMPDGHAYAFKGGFTLDEAIASMNDDGLFHLKNADAKWRETQQAIAALTTSAERSAGGVE